MFSIGSAGFASCIVAGALLTATAWAQAPAAPTPQAPGFSSKPVLASPITGVPGKELVLIAVTLEPGASSPPHNHPGDCYGTVVDGAIELRVEGLAARRFAAGESYANLSSVPHQFTNVGDKPVRMLNALVVELGKPRTQTLPNPVK